MHVSCTVALDSAEAGIWTRDI